MVPLWHIQLPVPPKPQTWVRHCDKGVQIFAYVSSSSATELCFYLSGGAGGDGGKGVTFSVFITVTHLHDWIQPPKGSWCMNLDPMRWQTIHILASSVNSTHSDGSFRSELALLTSVLNFDEDWTICPIEEAWVTDGKIIISFPSLKSQHPRGGPSPSPASYTVVCFSFHNLLSHLAGWNQAPLLCKQNFWLNHPLGDLWEHQLLDSDNVDVDPHQTSDFLGNKNNKSAKTFAFRMEGGLLIWKSNKFGTCSKAGRVSWCNTPRLKEIQRMVRASTF